MNRLLLSWLFAALVSVMLTAAPASADILWWSDNLGNSGTLNTTTMAVTNLFPTLTGGNALQDIAFGPGNVLYGIDGNNQLYTIAKSNGVATAVGSTNIANPVMFAMGYNFNNGVMYSGGSNQLYTVNLTAGTYTALPSTTGTATFAGDIQTAANGVTYYTDTAGDLVSLNLSTGVGTVVASNSIWASDQILGLALGSSGTLWGLTEDGELLTINPAGGAAFATVDGVIDYPSSPNGGPSGPIFFYGAGAANVATPEPATLTLMGLGVAGLAGYCWRRRQQGAVPQNI
jgi:hypothetical protein